MPGDEKDVFEEKVRGLDERVLSTLAGLPGRIAFSGLRRALGAHPESLSRSLRRLEREGRIDRSHDGYRTLDRTAPNLPQGLRPIAQVELPPGAEASALIGRLSGRWFGSLRWVGVVDGPTGRMLAWARKDGAGSVLLGFHRGTLRVYVRDEDWAEDDGDAEDSAYQLLTHAVEALRVSYGGSTGAVSFFAANVDVATRWRNS